MSDPTKTIVIRKQWSADFTRRYNKLKGDINRFILHNIRIRLNQISVEECAILRIIINEAESFSDIITNQAFDFGSSGQAVLEFLAFLQERIDDRIFDNAISPNPMWQNQYIDRAYIRGARVGAIELRKQGIEGISAAIEAAVIPDILGTAIPSIGLTLTPVIHPIHLDAIQLIYTRDFAGLRGITDEMSKQIARVIVDGIELGQGAAEIARNINDRVDKVGLSRSRLLARTETVRSYNVAKINDSVILEAETGLDVKLEWVTAGDERVRSTHVFRNGKVFEEKQARALIGEPNCRCALIPHIEGLDDV